MRRTLLLLAVPVLGLLGLVVLPQEAQAQRFWGGGGIGYGRGYYDYPYYYGYGYRPSYGLSYYYPNYGYPYYDSMGVSSPIYRYDYSMPASTYSADNDTQNVIYDANGQAWDVPEPQQNNGQLIFVAIRVPQNAQLWIDNQATTQRGMNRMFVSPPVTAGRSYTYEIKAQWKDPAGRDVTRTQKVTVQPGQITPVDLMNAQPAAPQPTIPQQNIPNTTPQPTVPPQTRATIPGLG